MDRLLPWLRRSGWVYLLVVLALAAVAWRTGVGAGEEAAPQPVPAASAPVEVRRAPARPVLVHVAGEVRRPGVYRLPTGARVVEALRRAGGPRRAADLAGLNLAAAVQDGQQVLVPRRLPAAAAAAGTATAPAAGPISLSSATAAELEELDGIGPSLAQRIVDWRTAHGGFASVDQLLEVPGIGPARLEAMRGRVQP